MDLSWQDSVGSFLDTLATDPGSSLASFVDGVGAALWSAPSDTASPSGAGSLLWSDLASSSDDTSALNFGTADQTSWAPDSALPTAGLLWADPSGNAVWSGNGTWATENGMLTTTGFADSTLAQGAASAVSPLWQAILSNFADAGGGLAPVFASAMNDVSWTATGGTGQPPMISLTPAPQLTSLAGSGALAQALFSTLAPQQLLWTDQSGAAGLVTEPTFGATATPPFMSGAGMLTGNPVGVPISGAGMRS